MATQKERGQCASVLIKGEDLLAGHSLSNDHYVQRVVQLIQSDPIFIVLIQNETKQSPSK